MQDMDDKEIRTYLKTCLAQFQDHQKALADLAISLKAVIETLKAQNPVFADAYDANYEALAEGEDASERDAIVQRIETEVLRLESK